MKLPLGEPSDTRRDQFPTLRAVVAAGIVLLALLWLWPRQVLHFFDQTRWSRTFHSVR